MVADDEDADEIEVHLVTSIADLLMKMAEQMGVERMTPILGGTMGAVVAISIKQGVPREAFMRALTKLYDDAERMVHRSDN